VKTLFVVSFAPYPPTNGSPLRTWQHINVLAMRGPVSVFSVGGGREPETSAIPGVAEWTHVDNADFPSSGGLLATLLRILLPRQYSVPNALARFAINKRLRETIERFQPDIIVLAHWKNALPGALRGRAGLILDMHNVESLLGTDVRHIRPALLRSFMLWRWRIRERGLARRAARVWVCGPNDAVQLKRLDPRLPEPVIWPNAVDLKRYEPVRNGTVSLPAPLLPHVPTLIYIGVYYYHPNVEAAMELMEQIFPLVSAQLPNSRLVLIGDGATDDMKACAARDPRILLAGKVDDLVPFLAAADACIVPIRTGGGTRLKILECFAAKIPVVSTSKGAEGIDAVSGREIRIAESPRELAERALELMSDPEARERQVNAAFDLVQRAYSWDSLAARIEDALPPLSRRSGYTSRP